MLEGMNRKSTHELTGTRRGVSIVFKIKAPSTLDCEALLEAVGKTIWNQIDVAVPKAQEKMPLDEKKAKRSGRSGLSKQDGKAAGAGRSAQ